MDPHEQSLKSLKNEQSLMPRMGRHDTVITIRHPAMILMAAALAIAALIVSVRRTPSGIWEWTVVAMTVVSVAVGIIRPKACGPWMVIAGTALAVMRAVLLGTGHGAWIIGAGTESVAGDGHASTSQTVIAMLLVAQMMLGVALTARFGGAGRAAAAAAAVTLAAGCCPPLGANAFPGSADTTILRLTAACAAAVAAAGLGLAARRARVRKRDDDRTERLLRQIELFRHGDQLAIAMHDTLSNDLTFIASVARRHRSDSDPAMRRDWQAVYQRSQQAFAQTHGIIDFLAGNAGSDGTKGHASTPYERMCSVVGQARDGLAALGYGGEATVEGVVATIDPDAECEAESLIREIGTNISRHVTPDAHAYELYVTLTADAVTIRELNDIPSAGHAPRLTDAERSGRGLTMHRARIAQLGGVLRTRADDGMWMTFARIPCQPMTATC